MAACVGHPLLGGQLAHHEVGSWRLSCHGVSRLVHVGRFALSVGGAKINGCVPLRTSAALAGVVDIGIHEYGGLACLFDVGVAEP